MIQAEIPQLLTPLFEQEHTRDLFWKNNAGMWEFAWDRIAFYLRDSARWIGKYDQLFMFDVLVYRLVPFPVFAAQLQLFLEPMNLTQRCKYTNTKAKEVYTQVYNLHYLAEDMNNEENIIPFEDGFYMVGEKSFFVDKTDPQFDFSAFHFTDTLHLKYHDTSGIQKFLKLLHLLLPGEDDQEKILRFWAYSLLKINNNQRYHQVWYGLGNNGKTQLAEHWGCLLGDLCSFISFNSLLSDNHAEVGLRGKHLNVCSEISGILMNQPALDKAKALTTNRYLEGRDVYESQNKAKSENITRFLLTTNDTPYSEFMVKDYAFFSRWDLIYFGYVWKDEDWREFANPKKVFDDIFRTESAGIMHLVLSYLDEIPLLKVDQELTQKKWLEGGNSAIAFLHSDLVSDSGDSEKRELYDQYKSWCNDNNREYLGYQTFFKVMKNRGYTQVLRWDTTDDGHARSHYVMEGIIVHRVIQQKLR